MKRWDKRPRRWPTEVPKAIREGEQGQAGAKVKD